MTYPGGKNGAGVYQTLINLMPPHDTYVEPFLGSGAVMRLKRPAQLNFGIDLAPAAVQALRAAMPAPIVNTTDAPEFWFRCQDGLAFLESCQLTRRDLVYCDPPYLMSTRSGRRIYEHEFTDVDHRRLLRCCRTLPCMVIISGYWSKLYAKALAGWNTATFQSMTRGGTPRTEWLWYNYPPPVALHDYRFLGSDFRQRQDLKRKAARWVARLEAMPMLERRALLSAIATLGESADPRGGIQPGLALTVIIVL